MGVVCVCVCVLVLYDTCICTYMERVRVQKIETYRGYEIDDVDAFATDLKNVCFSEPQGLFHYEHECG